MSDGTVGPPDVSTSTSAGAAPSGSDREPTDDVIRRAREVLARSKAIDVPEEDPELDELLGRADANLAAATKAAIAAGAARDRVNEVTAVLRDARERMEAEQRAALAAAAAAAKRKAEEPPLLDELTTSQRYYEKVAKAGSALLAEPLSERTRKAQERLLTASFVTILLAQGLVLVEKAQFGGFDMRGSRPWSLPLAAGLLCLYLLVAFLASYYRDVTSYEVLRVPPAAQLQVLTKQATIENAIRLAAVARALESAIVSGQPVEDAISAVDRAMRAHDPVVQKINAIAGVLVRTQRVDRVRLWIDVLLPTAIALLAVLSSAQYVYKAAVHVAVL